MSLVRQALYSPDLAPCIFGYFAQLKTTREEKQFQSLEDIMQKLEDEQFQRIFHKGQNPGKSVLPFKGNVLKYID